MDSDLRPPGWDDAASRSALESALRLAMEAIDAESRDPPLLPISGEALRSMIDRPAPREGSPATEAIDELRETALAHARRNGHAGFFAYVGSPADPIGIAGDLIASAMNQNVTAWRSAPTATTIERVTLRWLDELLGFGGGGRGAFTSGGSAANMHAMAAAVLRAESREPGLTRERMTMHLSTEGHLSLDKAAQILGISPDRVRRVGVDDRRAMRVEELDESIEADRRAGLAPVFVCAAAGSTNTGAVDPLVEVAGVCRRRGVWMHIDGAYGAPAAMTRRCAGMREGFALADSLSIDPHKWLGAPLDIGCSLHRDPEALENAFGATSEYVRVHQTDEFERFAFFNEGMELSRRFRALKLWLILRVRGADAIAREIERHIALRERLGALVEASPNLERVAEGLSVACFRVRPPGADDARADALTEAALARLNATGRFLLSPTKVDGRPALRVCIVNFRTRAQDIDDLVAIASAGEG